MLELLKKAPSRFKKSFGYCRDALAATFAKEESFRLETIAFAILLAVMLLCGWPWWKKLSMLAGYILIPLTEILNSAIEDVCNLITIERNPLVKNAKDKGALAVLFAIILNALLLIALLMM